MLAKVGALAAKMTASGPHKRRGVCIPPASRFFDSTHDVLRRSWRRTVQRTVDENPLDRLGHDVEPLATERGVQRHHTMCEQPLNETARLMPGQVAHDR